MSEPIELTAPKEKRRTEQDKKHKSRDGPELSPTNSRQSMPKQAIKTNATERSKFADMEMRQTERSLLSFLEENAKNVPEKPAITWITDEKGTEAAPLTYRTLWRSIGQVAHLLLNKYELKKGDRVLLLFEPGPQFVQVFLGCLNAGIIAVPLYPPINLTRDVPKIMKVMSNCQPKLILVTSLVKNALTIDRVKRKAKGLLRSSSVLPELDLPADLVKELDFDSHHDTCYDTSFERDRVAFLQYTSGSTGDPKGVMLTVGNLAFNHSIMNASIQLTGDETHVSWLPLYHDMGLIGGLMLPLRQGASFYGMSPVTFIRNPSLFIEKVSAHKSSVVVSPNFGYVLLARKWHGQRSIDLTNVRYACVAAERIFPATVAKFTDTFAPYGFKGEAFNPMYGLAEHTVFVCDKDAPNDHVTVVDDNYVACGVANKRGVSVKIVDPETRTVKPDGEIGEIWADSPSKALGYWADQERTDGTFFGRISGESSVRSYLRTGDLGKLVKGELVITGRIKEIIILRGRNFYPEDIENAAQQASEQLRPGCVAAFHVDGSSGERLVIVAEAREESLKPAAVEEIAGHIRREVQASLAIEVWRIVIITPRTIPKTSSGKLQRLLCKQMLLRNELKVIGDSNTDNIRGSRKKFAAAPPSPDASNNNITALKVEGEEDEEKDGEEPLLEPIGDDFVAKMQKEIASCADTDSRSAAIVKLITTQLTSMGITIDNPSVQSLWESGLDSIRAIELKATLERIIGTSLPTSVFYDNASIVDLSRSLAELIEDDEEDEAGAAEEEMIPEAPWWKVTLVSLGQLVAMIAIAFLLLAAAWPILKLAYFLSKRKLIYALIFLPGGYILYGLELAIGVIILKWIVIGKYSAGEYPIWGWYYFRWWVIDRLVSFTNPLFMDYFKGTPLLNVFYLGLGVRCSLVDYIDTTLITEFDLVSIGRNSAINSMARICPHSFSTRFLRMGAIELQPGAFISPRALLTPLNGTEPAQYLYVQPLTSKDLPPPNLKRASAAYADNTNIEANHSGSCCSLVGTRNLFLGGATALLTIFAIAALSVAISYASYRFAAWIADKADLLNFEFIVFRFGPIVRTAAPFDAQQANIGYIVTAFLFMLGPLFLPFLFVIIMVQAYEPTLALAKQKYLIELLWLLPLAYIAYLLTLAVSVVALKWAVGWRLGRNEMNVWGVQYYRRWVAATWIAWAWARLSVFYGGTYLSALWWRALGMQVGFGVTIANFIAPIEPDLISVGDSATIGDYSLLATRTVRNGIAVSRAVSVGKASTVGGHSVMMPGSRMGNNTILGALSYVPEDFAIPADASAFVGAPARGLNLQQAGGLNAPLSDFNEWSFGCLDVVDFAYALFAVPVLLLLLAFVAYPNFLLTQYFYKRWGWGVGVALVPAAWLGYVLALVIVLVAVKWLVFWRVQEATVKLRSIFYWRRLFFLMTYYLCVTVFMPLIQGTVYFNFMLVALGAKISPRAIVNTILITEPDLVELRRNSVIANGTVLHGHLVQKGKMELGPLVIQENCVVGPHCFLLIGSTLQNAVRLQGVSLVMKQDTLVTNKTYGGSPCGIIVRAKRRNTRSGTQAWNLSL